MNLLFYMYLKHIKLCLLCVQIYVKWHLLNEFVKFVIENSSWNDHNPTGCNLNISKYCGVSRKNILTIQKMIKFKYSWAQSSGELSSRNITEIPLKIHFGGIMTCFSSSTLQIKMLSNGIWQKSQVLVKFIQSRILIISNQDWAVWKRLPSDLNCEIDSVQNYKVVKYCVLKSLSEVLNMV